MSPMRIHAANSADTNAASGATATAGTLNVVAQGSTFAQSETEKVLDTTPCDAKAFAV